MNRPSSFEDRLDAFLGEGPSTGPTDLLATAHARARTVRQRPTWWLALKGDTMDTTWRARPVDLHRLGYILLILSLAAALVLGGLIVGSRLLRDDGRRAMTLPIPSGPGQLLAFTSWSSDPAMAGDLYVARADGGSGRRLTADALDDWSPAWSPDGSRIAVYSNDDDSVQLRVVASDGIHVLADSPGCFNTTQAPAWSPDGRFIVYAVDRMPDDEVCDILFTDLFVVPTDGSAPGRRLLGTTHTGFSTLPAWSGDTIAFEGNERGSGGLWVATVTDPAAPWDLDATRVDASDADPIGFGWTRWAPSGAELATTYVGKNGPRGNAVVIASDGSRTRSLWSDPTVDSILPDWSPDGSRLSLLVSTAILSDHAIYDLAIVGTRDGEVPRTIETEPLSGNGGPAMFSPDGTLIAGRAEEGAPIPGDVLIIPVEDTDPASSPVRIPARQWSSVSWQPVANPANPAADAPVGLPEI